MCHVCAHRQILTSNFGDLRAYKIGKILTGQFPGPDHECTIYAYFLKLAKYFCGHKKIVHSYRNESNKRLVCTRIIYYFCIFWAMKQII